MTKSGNPVYTQKYHLRGHQGAILCLSATEDGKLASGGEFLYAHHTSSDLNLGTDGSRIWDLQDGKMLHRPVGAGQRGSTTALVWIQREDEPDDGLVYGTQNGFLVCWQQCSFRGYVRPSFRSDAAKHVDRDSDRGPMHAGSHARRDHWLGL